MKAAVIGFGSIGRRHAKILESLYDEVIIQTAQEIQGYESFRDIESIIEQKPNYIVIAKPTNEHYEILKQLVESELNCKVLVEKPIFEKAYDLTADLKNVYVAYNFRFHPLIEKLKKEILGEKILSVQAYVGQYLPTWRPDTDYRKSYSADKSRGGGVLRDLSHELDYLMYLFGDWKKLCAQQSKLSALEINSDDSVSMLIESEKVKQISLQLNYLDRIGQRFLIINCDSKTIKLDFMAATFSINEKLTKFKIDRDDSYRAQHKSALSDGKNICTYIEAIKIMKMIEAIESSQKLGKWVQR